MSSPTTLLPAAGAPRHDHGDGHGHDHDHDGGAAAVADGPASCRIDIGGMDCGDCAKTIEASLAGIEGVRSARVSFARGSAEVAFDPARVDRAAIDGRIAALGYTVAPARPASTGEASAGAGSAGEGSAGAGSAAAWAFDVAGMDCGDCAKTIEAGVRRVPGVADAAVNFGSATLTVTPASAGLAREDIVAAVRQAGYAATPRGGAAVDAPPWWRTRRVIETAVAVLLWAVGFALERAGAGRAAYAAPYLAAMAVSGYPVARAGWFALRARRADMNVLMTVAAVGAVAIGEWGEGATVLVLFMVGLTLQTMTLDRTRRAIQALVRLAPEEATVRRDGAEVRVPVAGVAVGETVVVRPGERVPVDGTVLAGRSAVDQAPITGESVPVEVEPESGVYAGSINGDGVIEVRSTKAASDTTLSRIIHAVEEAQGSRAPAQAFVDRFAAIYTPVVIAAALAMAVVGPLVTGDTRDWVVRALVLLVVACPCALVISTPVALVAAIGSASRRGVLFKGGVAIESLAKVRSVAFDKTGTLTAGRPAVTDVVPLGGRGETELLARAAAVEAFSSHPIALAVVRAAFERGLPVPEVADARGIPGKGATARLGAETVVVGSRRLFPAIAPEVEETLTRLEREGRTAVLVGSGEGAGATVEGILAVADPVRPASVAAVADLNGLGLRTVMLTGDNRHTAERIAGEVGVTEVHAELLPEDKVAEVTAIRRGGPVAMIGDGVNDAPALATAEVGVAMGLGGTDVAIEAADVALMGDDLAQLPVAVRLSRLTMAIIRQNIAVAIGSKAVFLGLTFAGATSLWLAVVVDVGMSLLVTANSLRLIRAEQAEAEPPRPARPAAALGAPALGGAAD